MSKTKTDPEACSGTTGLIRRTIVVAGALATLAIGSGAVSATPAKTAPVAKASVAVSPAALKQIRSVAGSAIAHKVTGNSAFGLARVTKPKPKPKPFARGGGPTCQPACNNRPDADDDLDVSAAFHGALTVKSA